MAEPTVEKVALSKWCVSRFTDGLIEASIYLAVLLTPILVDVNLQRIFVLPKVALIRLLAAVILAAWGYQALGAYRQSGRPPLRPALRHPLAAPGLAVGLTLVLSTCLSILPYTSVWGGFLRVQGLWTEASYAVLALAVALHVRSQATMRRVVDLVLLTSWPVGLYALLQSVGLDPLSWIGYTGRVLSTLGNPIFLGAYVALVAPLTLYRGLTLLAAHRAQPTASSRLGLVWVGSLLLVQLLSLVLSQSRGPVVAVVIELGLLIALLTRRRSLVMGLVGVVAVGALLLAAVNLPGSPLQPVRAWPVVGRLTDWRDANYRDVIWSHVVLLIDARLDRFVVGYGPETLDVALVPFYTTRLAYLGGQAQQIDRTHNAILEALVTSGLLGLGAQVWAFLAVSAFGLAALGVLRTRRQQLLLYGLPVGLGLALALATRLLSGVWTWSALAAGLGLLAGLGVVVAGVVLRRGGAALDRTAGDAVLSVCLLTGWVGHFAEAQFSPTAEAVLLYVWLGVGLLVANTRLPAEEALVERPEVRAPGGRERRETRATEGESSAPGSRPALLDAVLVGLLTLALIVGLIDWTPPFNLNGHLAVVLGLALVTWSLAMLWSRWRAGDANVGQPRLDAVWQVAYLSLSLVFSGLTLYVMGQFVSLVLLPVALVYLLLLAALAVLAWVLSDAVPLWPAQVPPRLAALALGLLTLGAAVWLAFLPHVGDRYFALGRRLVGQGQTPQGVEMLARARQAAPDQDVYFLISSDVLATVAVGVGDPTQQAAAFERARAAGLRAMALKPGQPYHLANLAHIDLRWAESTRNSAQRTTAMQRGLDTLAQVSKALAFDPAIFDDWGYLYYLRRELDAALAKYQTALALDPSRPQTYILRGRAQREAGDVAAAEQSYTMAIRLDKERVDAYSELTELYLEQGRAADALPYAERAVQLAPTRYALHHNLALVYTKLGRNSDAAEQIRIALRYAPTTEEARLRTLLQQLSGQ